ncbi:sigma-70 family RNA polymerase sigma factor [Nibricoccus sp. IMCC34717]|uniref:sigma-70 family RNA polymerase sigma factor n=1 Tax=Nibricoccus sp. IMCC34717 TaxID=3034021 RepID=UPI00384F2A97
MSVQSHSFEIIDLLDVVHAAVAVVSRRLPAHVDRDDLRAAGYLALVQHFERAPMSESEARAFLMRRVAGALRDELRRADAVGRRTRWLAKAAFQVESAIEASTGFKPDIRVVAAQLEVSVARLEAAMQATANASAVVPSEQLDRVADAEPDPSQVAASHDDFARVRGYLDILTERERSVVEITILEDGTLEEAAAQLGITKGRAHQLRKAALARLRSAMCQ